jgi:hypothetical protein
VKTILSNAVFNPPLDVLEEAVHRKWLWDANPDEMEEWMPSEKNAHD